MQPKRIPPEVLAEIFLECLDTERWEDRDAKMPSGPGDAPHLLTQICRHWRAVAMSTPRLWSTLFFPDIPETRERCDALFARVPVWLSLSKCLPLSFVLRIENDAPVELPQYVALLQKEIHRWRAARFETSANQVHWFPAFAPHSMPLLEEFAYDGWSDTSIATIPTLMTSLASAPRLRDVDLAQNQIYNWALPWANLTTLHLIYETVELPTAMIGRLCESLGACARLDSLHVGFSNRTVGPVLPSTSRIVIPVLTELSITCSHIKGIVSVMHTLVAPRLQDLHIDRTDFEFDYPPAVIGASIRTFVARSKGAPIRMLGLEDVHLDPDELVALLALLPSLEYLSFQGGMIDSRVLDALTLKFDAEGQLVFGPNPRLRHVSFLPPQQTFGLMGTYRSTKAVLPLSMHANSPFPAQGSNTPDLITFARQLQPPREALPPSRERLTRWLRTVGSSAFCGSLAGMIRSRWAVPPNSDVPRAGLELVQFDLHILQKIMPARYADVMECWREGMNLNIWCSKDRMEFWRSATWDP